MVVSPNSDGDLWRFAMVCGCLSYPFQQFVFLKSFFKFLEGFSIGLRLIKGHATRNDIVDISSSTMAFNVAKIL